MTPQDAAVVRDAAATFGAGVGDETLVRLDRFLAVLATWNRSLRLTGERDRRTILTRHVVDSLAPVACLPVTGRVIDVGSGAGFPGIVLGCARPDLELLLVEPRRRRASFLGEVVRTLPLPSASVICARAEDLAGDVRGTGDVVISRALRPDVFLPLAVTLVSTRGTAITMQTADAATKVRAPADLRLSEVREYRLPDGRRRALLLYVRS
jgi:16S rRNA (guanine527-N7)-methyltransferase